MAELTVPRVDFSTLGELPQVYRKAQQDELRKQTLANLGQGGAVDAATLLKSGDLSLAQLGIQMQNRQAEESWRREEAARSQRNADRSFDFTKSQALEKPTIQKVKDVNGNEVLVRVLPDGTSTPIDIGGDKTAGNPFSYGKQNETQSKDSGYANRMFQSEGVLRDPKLAEASQSMFDRAASRVLPGDVSNRIVSEGYQKYDQAARDFINATLRRESGAAISQSEFDNAYTQYLPRPGDTKEVLAQKQRNRQATIAGIAGGGGAAYRPPFTFGPNGEMVPSGNPTQGATPAGKPISKAQYDALPSGTPFTAPDGSRRIKP